jgi:hypothetical protein
MQASQGASSPAPRRMRRPTERRARLPDGLGLLDQGCVTRRTSEDESPTLDVLAPFRRDLRRPGVHRRDALVRVHRATLAVPVGRVLINTTTEVRPIAGDDLDAL